MSLYKEDVYETEDPPLPAAVDPEEHFENKEVEKIHIDLQGSRRRFGGYMLEGKNADFSDSVATMRLKRGYKVSEIYECDPVEEEEQFERKYERICMEVENLMAESRKRKEEPSQVNKTDISVLHDLLKSMASPTTDEKELENGKMSELEGKQDIPEMPMDFEAMMREMEKYRDRVIPVTSVQEFNKIINEILDEYQRVVEYCSKLIANRQEYIKHLKLTDKAAQDIKDKKIEQLEQMVRELQKRTMANAREAQLRAIKHGSVPAANSDDTPNDVQQRQNGEENG